MTVKELIEELRKLPQDLPVFRAAGKHDDWYEDVLILTVERLTGDCTVMPTLEEEYGSDPEPEDMEDYAASYAESVEALLIL